MQLYDANRLKHTSIIYNTIENIDTYTYWMDDLRIKTHKMESSARRFMNVNLYRISYTNRYLL